MITGRTIICLASAWDYDPTSKHHVMRVLSQHDNEIVWVNYHASRRPRASAADLRTIARKLAGAARRPQQVVPHITVVTPLVLPLPGSAAAAAINRALVVRQVRRVLRGLPDRPVQLWSFAPDAAALA
ncbi:MAG: glycosyltransferase family 1 protein, partial [Phycisphaerae bacterium]